MNNRCENNLYWCCIYLRYVVIVFRSKNRYWCIYEFVSVFNCCKKWRWVFFLLIISSMSHFICGSLIFFMLSVRNGLSYQAELGCVAYKVVISSRGAIDICWRRNHVSLDGNILSYYQAGGEWDQACICFWWETTRIKVTPTEQAGWEARGGWKGTAEGYRSW